MIISVEMIEDNSTNYANYTVNPNDNTMLANKGSTGDNYDKAFALSVADFNESKVSYELSDLGGNFASFMKLDFSVVTWLRSPGDIASNATIIHATGGISGYSVNHTPSGRRAHIIKIQGTN